VFRELQVEQGPEVTIPFQDNMRSPATVPAIRTAHGGEFIPHKMLVPCPAMPAAAINTYLVNKIALLQNR